MDRGGANQQAHDAEQHGIVNDEHISILERLHEIEGDHQDEDDQHAQGQRQQQAHHSKDEFAQTLAEILRVLAPGGVAIMTVPHRWWIFETHGASLPILPWNRVPFFSWLPKQIHDTWARARNYRRKEIIELLREAGFVDIRAVLLTAPMDVIKIKILQKILRSVIFVGDVARIPFLSSNIFVYAKKNT